MDFGDFVNPRTMTTNNISSNQRDQVDQPSPSGSGSNGGWTPNPNSRQNTPVFSHQVEHSGVVCDSCNCTIFGFRYKCCQCKDFDLCSTCERRGLHAGHCMLRIAFPELAQDAIKTYIMKSKEKTTPIVPLGFAGAIPVPPAFDSESGKKRHCKRERHSANHSSSSPDSCDEIRFPWGTQCPVVMGKKEIKKWAKCMKKTAQMHKRSAEAYAARMAGAASDTPCPTEASAKTTGENPLGPAFDFSAAASQIQGFLNAFGLPIDVVELYDELGSGKTPTSAGSQSTNNIEVENNKEESIANVSEPGDIKSEPSAITEGLQNLSIATSESELVNNNTAPSSNIDIHTSNGTIEPRTEADPDTDWTLLEADRGEESDQPSGDENSAFVDCTSVSTETQSLMQTPVAVQSASLEKLNLADSANGGTSSSRLPESVTTEINQIKPPAVNPQLPTNLQQVMSGITNTVGNVMRNIPVVSWNSLNYNGNASLNQGEAEWTEPMQMTLNQLLSMGFSNQDGWLARLVASKNGNLEEVLNSLFPVQNTSTNSA